MAYSDFDLQSARERFGLSLVEDEDLFAAVAEVEPGESLLQTLQRWAPAALAMNTEKARSEMIIAPILMNVVMQSGQAISLFSGISFDVDREQGLNGACDFLIARSRELFYLSRPVIAVVEAKREDIVAGLGQCVAALVAAQIFNSKSGENQIGPVFGAVTTGNVWRFLKLEGSTVWIDRPEYHFHQIGKILGILLIVVV
jgi:hypothetical protein